MEKNDFFELDQMRQQMALLKSKLDNEELVNDKLLRESMKSKADTVNRQGRDSIIAGVVVIVLMFCFFLPHGFSLLFCLVTVLMMLFCIGATWYIHRPVNCNLLSGDLLTVAKTMLKLKKAYQDWLKIGIPMVVLWILYFGFEIYRFFDYSLVLALPIMGAGLAGAVIGSIIGIRMYKKVLNTCDEMVRQIESTQQD